MQLDPLLILEMLQTSRDPYLVGYRWMTTCPHVAISARRNLLKAARDFPELISVASTKALETDYSTHRDGHYQSVSHYREQLGPVPTQLLGIFIELNTKVEVIVFAHHLFYDGTALWNLAKQLFDGDFTTLADRPELSQNDNDEILRIRRRISSIAPEVESVVTSIANVTVTKALTDACIANISELGIFDRIVAPHRTNDHATRTWGSYVEYRNIETAHKHGQHRAYAGGTASVSFDLFAQGDPSDGLAPQGIYSFSQRTDCDILVEQVGTDIKITVSTEDHDLRKIVESAVLKAIRS